jgi:hypothetical protein
MSLANIYLELHRRARETGEDRAQTLGKGARIAVRVQGDVVTLTISRSKKLLGATEIETFKRDCGVPSDAIRFPQEGQGTIDREGMTWRYIAWRWREETTND